ncbi:hypothetical protein HOY34_09660 [Xinfangfangia sp. D13-10-4-6]|uniref:hypothetical protein n=1 Tax=Pseudogemmobacter hezensis TaxID=2737662 RepID=UPI00155428AE|nr:hypothetical protein [Pseudogemmobacter hezensis]NPD15464.1 hypothetical protein [Pseudogemmobacter hezensis]
MSFGVSVLENAFIKHAELLEDHSPLPFMALSDAGYFYDIHTFLSRGFPVSVSPCEDWLAIDRHAGANTMLQFSTNVFDTGATEISLGLVPFLAVQAALGPTEPDLDSIRAFSTGYTQIPARGGLNSPTGFAIDTPNSMIWRDWFWGGQPPMPPDSLMQRCRGPVIG